MQIGLDFFRLTDGQTDEQTDKVKPAYPLSLSFERGYTNDALALNIGKNRSGMNSKSALSDWTSDSR